jgi:hypothetical protein
LHLIAETGAKKGNLRSQLPMYVRSPKGLAAGLDEAQNPRENVLTVTHCKRTASLYGAAAEGREFALVLGIVCGGAARLWNRCWSTLPLFFTLY